MNRFGFNQAAVNGDEFVHAEPGTSEIAVQGDTNGGILLMATGSTVIRFIAQAKLELSVALDDTTPSRMRPVRIEAENRELRVREELRGF